MSSSWSIKARSLSTVLIENCLLDRASMHNSIMSNSPAVLVRLLLLLIREVERGHPSALCPGMLYRRHSGAVAEGERRRNMSIIGQSGTVAVAAFRAKTIILISTCQIAKSMLLLYH